MQNAITKTPRRASALAFSSALGLLVGCGYPLDPGHLDSTMLDPGCLEGAQVELVRYSSLCQRTSPKSLTAEVDQRMEFSAEQVRTLESPCTEGPNPGGEVHVDHASIIFDFSNVVQAGRFPKTEFEGYVLSLVLREDNALLVGASLDRETSTLGLDNTDLSFDAERIEVNFEDVSYDKRGLVKIDLLFAAARPMPDEGR